jgi:hypothetical protein
MYIYLVRHLHRVDDEDNDVFEGKIIGIFSSELKAREAIEFLSDKPGFVDYPEDFVIEDYKIDEVEWDHGFIKGWTKGEDGAGPTTP